MITIYSQKAFYELKKVDQNDGRKLLQTALEILGDVVPVFAGGLDHVSETSQSYTFHDIGMSGCGYVKDNTWKLLPYRWVMSKSKIEKRFSCKIIKLRNRYECNKLPGKRFHDLQGLQNALYYLEK